MMSVLVRDHRIVTPMGWSPFDKQGRLRLVLATDPWWKRLCARLRRDGVWHNLGTAD